MTGTASEQEYKIEDYHNRPVLKAAYFGTLEEAKSAAGESLGLDGSVRPVRLLGHDGRIAETLERGAE